MHKLILLSLVAVGITGCEDGQSPELPAGVPLIDMDITPVNAQATSEKKEEIKGPPVSKEGPWPKFVAEELTYEFGKMQVGTKLDHRFKIRNEGEAPLVMVEGKTTCKCTKFALGKKTLQPGEETELHIEWHGKFQDRAFQHGGPVLTNDPESTIRRFVVRGVVDNAYQLNPSGTWKVNGVTQTEPGKMQGTFCSRIFDEFEIIEIKNVPPLLTVTAEPMDAASLRTMEARCGYNINVEVSPDMPAGLLEESFELVVDKGQNEPIIIGVSATREGAIRVVGTKGAIWVASSTGLKFGTFPAKAGKEAVMTLAVRKEEMSEPLEIVSCTTNPKFLSAVLEPSDSESSTLSRYRLKVKVPPGAPKARWNSSKPATVEIKTNHPRGEPFKFQVTFNSF